MPTAATDPRVCRDQRRGSLARLAAVLACAGLVGLVGARFERERPRTAEIHYELAHDPSAACWRVSLRATAIDPGAGAIRIVLEDWGEWTEIDSLYLRELRVHPAALPDPGSPAMLVIDTPPGWDGTLDASYVLSLTRSGSRAQQSHGLLPSHEGIDAAGFSINTLVDLMQGEQRLQAQRTIRFVAPPDVTIATGWGGVSRGTQEVRFDHPIDNVPLVFGHASGISSHEAGGLRYEVAQFGTGRDITREVLRVAQALVPLYGRHSGRAQVEPVRIFLTSLKSGGTNTDHGCIVGYPSSDFDGALSPEFIRLVAHELFHVWLGGFLAPPEDESLVWFHEGFTEYFAVWHVAAAAQAAPEWFAERVAATDAAARASQSFGRVAFADPGVRWRDGDGPNETLGYRGGATLAFLADVELRRQGRPGLMQLVADLLEGGAPLELAAIREWMGSNGLGEFHASFVAKPAPLPDVDQTLREIGFETSDREASLTYLGIQIDDGESPARIVALDPDGPAARAGFEIGDRILDCSPPRPNPPRIGSQVTTRYRFGLNRIASGAKVATIEVSREGRRLSLSIQPQLVPGGLRTAYRRHGEEIERFLRYEAPRER